MGCRDTNRVVLNCIAFTFLIPTFPAFSYFLTKSHARFASSPSASTILDRLLILLFLPNSKVEDEPAVLHHSGDSQGQEVCETITSNPAIP